MWQRSESVREREEVNQRNALRIWLWCSLPYYFLPGNASSVCIVGNATCWRGEYVNSKIEFAISVVNWNGTVARAPFFMGNHKKNNMNEIRKSECEKNHFNRLPHHRFWQFLLYPNFTNVFFLYIFGVHCVFLCPFNGCDHSGVYALDERYT